MKSILKLLAVVVVFWSHGAVASSGELPGAEYFEQFVDGYGARPSAAGKQETDGIEMGAHECDQFVRGYYAKEGIEESTTSLPVTTSGDPHHYDQFVHGYYAKEGLEESALDKKKPLNPGLKYGFGKPCDLQTLPWSGGTVCIGKGGETVFFGDHMGVPDGFPGNQTFNHH